MQAVISFFAPILIFVSSLSGYSAVPNSSVAHVAATQQHSSVELGLHETSPSGAQGGFAMPASGCSPAAPEWHGYPVHDCAVYPTISVDHPIIRLGDPVTVSWDPRGNTNCTLSANLMALTPTPSAAAAGSIDDNPTGETTYSIVCIDSGNSASVTIKVLPRIQET